MSHNVPLLGRTQLPKQDPNDANLVTFGQVIGIHINDDIIVDGIVDVMKADVVSRLGYRDFGRIADMYTLGRSDWPLAEDG